MQANTFVTFRRPADKEFSSRSGSRSKCTRIRNEFGPGPSQYYFDFELNVNKFNSLALFTRLFGPRASLAFPRGRKCGHHLNANAGGWRAPLCLRMLRVYTRKMA